MFKRLIAAFKNLPPEARLFLAMAGLATPFGLVYLLQRVLKSLFGRDIPIFTLMIGMAVLIVAVALLGLLFNKLLGRGDSRRKKRLESELASGSESGLVSMDLRAAIKSNNEKFFQAIREMRKNVGISVYDLPWYIVIGDSGCGKTKLINESGLVFSTGRPEGYQLGTLNYNWWFTEDAVFVDMAGRLCNPQDDGDRKEWLAFLDTVGRGRRGVPVNGAILCVSAEHLLQDSPEQQERDANTALERLRDLQNKLGVTFATYLVVTKCDKILGFMQFFDRAGRDIAIKNQIFGWSRPGNFSDAYDPETFGNDFEQLYRRLDDLRLRRLADDADEIELGLAYGFPEEYRALREPLQLYIRTLFPMIRTPRALKNLLFRGIYFTSATQMGGLILKHLTERLGPGAADQFGPLEGLYPQPRPHFVKDLLARKVIPEHGLVFRNERQVVRNRKLSRLLKIGSSVLAVVVVGALSWSVWAFGNLIGSARENARKAPSQVEASTVALAGVDALGGNIDRLVSRPWPARILSLGIGASAPIRDLTRIQVRLFEEGVLRPALLDIDNALKTGKLSDPRQGEPAILGATAYMKSLEQYLMWVGCMNEASPPADLTFEGFQKLCAVTPHKEEFFKQAGVYFTTLREGGGWKNPARLLANERIKPAETIAQATIRLHNYLAGYATLDSSHPDPVIREWMRIRAACVDAMAAYDAMLQTGQRDIATQKDLASFKTDFVGAYDRFAAALAMCTWKGPGNPVRIGSLKEAILRQRNLWVDYGARLDGALRKCQAEPNPAFASPIPWLLVGDKKGNQVPGLDLVLARNIQEAGLSEKSYWDQFFVDAYYPKLVSELYEAQDQLIALLPHGQEYEPDRIELTGQAKSVQSILRGIRDQLVGANFEPKTDLSAEIPSDWIPELERLLLAGTSKVPTTQPAGDLSRKWRPEVLAALQDKYAGLIARGEGTRLLTTMAARLSESPLYGFAGLYPDWREKTKSAYQIQIPEGTAAAPTTQRSPGDTAAPEVRQPTIRRPGESTRRAREPAGAGRGAVPKPVAIELEGLVPACATHDFLNKRAWDAVRLMIYLDQFTEAFYLPGAGEAHELPKLCMTRLDSAGRAYTDAYVQAWAKAYEGKRLTLLDRLRTDRSNSWASLADALSDRRAPSDPDPREIGRELQASLQEILQAVPWAVYDAQRGWWKNQPDKEWTDVAAWLLVSLKEDKNHWPARYRQFATEAEQSNTEVNPAAPPWVTVAQAFDRAWMDVVAGIIANRQLPRSFEEGAKERPEIAWDAIQKLRQDTRLNDERLTGEFVAFSKQAQSVLSMELTQILCEVQEKHFAGQIPYDGWPYLNAAGEQLTALDTVAYKPFKDFLLEIGEAARVLGPLERGILDDDPLKPGRLALYKSCRLWRDFIGFTPQGQQTDLKIEVRYVDPLDPTLPGGKVSGIDDTAQNFYGEVQLHLGLSIQDPNQPGGIGERVPLRISTLTRGDAGARTAYWRWQGGGSASTLKMQLTGGIQGEGRKKPYPDTISPLILGSASPLALCAYLHRYAKFSDQNSVWVSSHALDLTEAFKRAGTTDLVPPDGRTRMGAKFTFKLDRAMPEPIHKLQKGAP